MNIVVPKLSGFCYGVKRSVSAAYNLARKGGAYMYGEVVHNPEVVADLQSKGLRLVFSVEEIPRDEKDAKILIRAHGLPASVTESIAERGFTVVDMTCPHVKKIHAVVAYACARGMDVIVCGTPGHPETEGTLSKVTTRAHLIKDMDDARRLIPGAEFPSAGVCLVSQTTHNHGEYRAIHAFLANECPNIPFLEPHDTICQATAHRQAEIRELAKTAGACIIVGGKTSSNVTKLYDIAREACPNTLHVESADQLDLTLLDGAETIMVSGGASTPDISVRRVIQAVRERYRIP
jgi:4-hydroxy-3-methylbut-2-enyl diphosphate reductase